MEVKKIKSWELDINSLFKEFSTGILGLTKEEVLLRQKEYGKNIIDLQKKRTALEVFISQFKNPLIIILFLASVISGFLGDQTSAIIIVLIISFSALISFFQEYKSEKSLEMLKKKVALKTQVIRNGKIETILASDLVLGDVVLLNFGNVAPADLRLIEADNLSLNESILTGESFPVEKSIEPQKVRDYLPQSMDNLVFMGTHVVQGNGRAVVVAIGKDTEFGKTAKMLSISDDASEFQKGISSFSFLLFRIIIVFSLVVFLFLSVIHGNWLESLLFSLSVAVGISPELMPMIITINLSSAARKMSKKSIIIKKLIAIENLGNADVLCTDKTGTLTEGDIVLNDFFDFSLKKNLKLLNLAKFCNSVYLDKYSDNPLDGAILDYVKKNKEKLVKEQDYDVVCDFPFDFERRRMGVVLQGSERILVVKGSSEEMLHVCTSINVNGKKRLTKKYLNDIREIVREQELSGFRVIILASKKIGKKSKYSKSDEKDLTLEGFLVFNDPLKKNVKESLNLFREMNVEIKILTGDTEESARYIAEKAGLSFLKIISGFQLNKLNDEELKREVLATNIFVKVTPADKLKIIRVLKEAGKVTAFLGDGVNDAAALRAADVGISVDSGTDVAKEAADVVLLKKSLSVLIDAVREGRRTFGNTLKYIYCTTSSNYGNMFSVVGASLILPFIPLLPVQVLLLNFLTDFPLLAISTDSVDSDYLKKPKHWNVGNIKNFMIVFGLISSCFDYIAYAFLLLVIKASPALFQSGWFWLSFLTEILLIFVIRTRKGFLSSKPSKWLIGSTIITLIIALTIMYYPPINNFFGFDVMPLWISMVLLGFAFLYFIVSEFIKRWFFNRYEK